MTAEEKTQEPIGWADEEAKEGPTLAHLMDVHDITITSVFVPWSLSRNSEEDKPSLNWRITLKHNGREIMTTDYGAGFGHCQSVDSSGDRIAQRWSINPEMQSQIRLECEDGKARQEVRGGGYRIKTRPVMVEATTDGAQAIAGRETHRTMPDAADVLHSLLLDGSAIDAGGFEDWAGDYGYDEDSRKAEKMYRECVDTGLKLRNTFGDGLLEELQEAARNL